MWYEIFLFELRYRVRRFDTYIFFLALFLFSLIAVDFVFAENDLGPVKENSYYVISYTMAALSAIFMMITSLVMGVSVLRDYEHNMEALLFVNPIKKWEYLLGRFLGSFIILVLIFSGILWGMILSEFLPWKEPDDLLAFNFLHYIQAFVHIILPALFFGGAIFFVSGALSRNLIIVYTQGIFFFLVLMLTRSIDNTFVSALLDPFGLSTLNEMTAFWSAAERNTETIPFQGILLYNRLIWILIGIGALVLGYVSFSFSMLSGKKAKKNILSTEEASPLHIETQIPVFTPNKGLKAAGIQLFYHTRFHLKAILKENSFWALLIAGMVIILMNGINLGTVHNVNSYPTSYLIIGELQELSIFFFLIILIFYSGELIWKERGKKLDLIFDALPVSDSVYLSSKFLALLGLYLILMCTLMLSGILFQTAMGYYKYELGVYFKGFFLEIFPFLALFTFASFFFQVVLNNKFVAYIAILFFFILTESMGILGYDHGLYKFGAENLGTYSDMNGYGHFLKPYLWFKVYWFSFCIALFIGIIVFSIRGKETGFRMRWKLAKERFHKPLLQTGLAALSLFLLVGAYIFYNTNVLNTYWSNEQQDTFRAEYEQKLKQYEHLPQPKIVDIKLKVDLFPSERNYTAEGSYLLQNKHTEAIQQIHVQQRLDAHVDIEYIKFARAAKTDSTYEAYGYYIYTLDQELLPGDSLSMDFKQTYTTKGFREKHADTEIVYNGTFFNGDDFPSFAYNSNYELRTDDERAAFGLSPRRDRPRIDDKQALKNARTGDDGYEINFDMLISTDSSQTAVVPGKLERSWIEGDRKFFAYKMKEPMINFYPLVSAKYECLRDTWHPEGTSLNKAVDLEIYYHKGHEYNLSRMMKSMKASLTYFHEAFSPYPYEQMRIMEVPRYIERAQSFPNTVPFSESIGFMMDVDEEEDVDMPFFITSHELAHQWWGLQVVAANVEGRSMLLESLAQYSAFMVMKRHFPKEKVRQLLDQEHKRYWEGRVKESQEERPLYLVESQPYIFYGKGAINFYALQEYISEDSVNIALRRFIRDWNVFGSRIHPERYASTEDLLPYLYAVSPDSMQYVIEDLFETITFHEAKIEEASFEQVGEKQYQVQLSIDLKKFRTDSLGKEVAVKTKDWIEVGIYGKNQEGAEQVLYQQKHKMTDTLTKLDIILSEEPTKVSIDPDHILIEKDKQDNSKLLSRLEE